MAQEYYSFMMNRFFETLFIQLMANIYIHQWADRARGERAVRGRSHGGHQRPGDAAAVLGHALRAAGVAAGGGGVAVTRPLSSRCTLVIRRCKSNKHG